MARTEARISVDIWNDDDFRALSRDAQWAFMFLLSQQDLAHDGVVALRVRRWAQSAAGQTVAEIGEALRELERTRFVVIDRDCEELLIRSFIRRDKVYRQPNVLRAAADHLPLVTSTTIRYALAVELARISQEPMPDGSADIVVEMRKALPDPSENPPPYPSGKGSADPKPDPTAGTPGVRGVVTAVGSDFPVPRSLDPSPTGEDSPTAKTIIGEWIEHCRGRPAKTVIGQVGKHVKALLEEGIDPDDVRTGLEAWRSKGQHPSTLPSFVNAATNADARASPGNVVALRGRPSTTDQRVGEALALAQHYRELDGDDP